MKNFILFHEKRLAILAHGSVSEVFSVTANHMSLRFTQYATVGIVALSLILGSFFNVLANGDSSEMMLNLSHITCMEDGTVEVHFVVVHVLGEVQNYGSVRYTLNGVDRVAAFWKRSGGVAHYTDYPSSDLASFTVSAAWVVLDGTVVYLHNPQTIQRSCKVEPSPTPTLTPSATPIPSPTPTASPIPSPSPAPSPSPSITPAPTPTPSETPSLSPTPSATPAPTPIPNESPSPIPSTSSGPTPSATATPTPSLSATPSPTPAPSETPSPSPSPSFTPSPTPSPSPSETPSPFPTPTPIPSETPSPTTTPSPLPTPTGGGGGGGGGGGTGSPARVAKTVRNVSAGEAQFGELTNVLPGDIVEFSITAIVAGSAGVGNISAEDTLPFPLAYIAASSKIDGITSTDDMDDGKISLPVILPSQPITITFLAQIPATATPTAAIITNTGFLTFQNTYAPVSDTASVRVISGTRPAPTPTPTPSPTVPGSTTTTQPKIPSGRVLGVFDVATGSPIGFALPLPFMGFTMFAAAGFAISRRLRYARFQLRRFIAMYDLDGITSDLLLLLGILGQGISTRLNLAVIRATVVAVYAMERAVFFWRYIWAMFAIDDPGTMQDVIEMEREFLRARKIS